MRTDPWTRSIALSHIDGYIYMDIYMDIWIYIYIFHMFSSGYLLLRRMWRGGRRAIWRRTFVDVIFQFFREEKKMTAPPPHFFFGVAREKEGKKEGGEEVREGNPSRGYDNPTQQPTQQMPPPLLAYDTALQQFKTGCWCFFFFGWLAGWLAVGGAQHFAFCVFRLRLRLRLSFELKAPRKGRLKQTKIVCYTEVRRGAFTFQLRGFSFYFFFTFFRFYIFPFLLGASVSYWYVFQFPTIVVTLESSIMQW